MPNLTDLKPAITAGVNDNDVMYASDQDLSYYDEHYIQVLAGTVDVVVSFDGGATYSAPLAFEDLNDATGAKVVALAAGNVYRFNGQIRKMQVLQSGVTASNCVVVHTRSPD